ncbi:uncharacterized protein LOC124795558 [Schistocerca piceifrons]|uniref:uncharacterized protein LOC124795558 n=1 Tax=Schistocerca piceifrons TaxID=274613 RepID=UPI001F5F1D32|nr:uncharacterized protein LOC124795558 [Schistocerca piceifrons]
MEQLNQNQPGLVQPPIAAAAATESPISNKENITPMTSGSVEAARRGSPSSLVAVPQITTPKITAETPSHYKSTRPTRNRKEPQRFLWQLSNIRKTSMHGGTCIYVREDVKHENLKFTKQLGEEQNFEISATELTNLNIIVICIYRSPDGNVTTFTENLENALNSIKIVSKTTIICGDFNIDFNKNSKDRLNLEALLKTYNIHTTIKSPTRVTKLSSSAIDQILINTDKYLYKSGNMNTGFSDHYTQFIEFPVDTEGNTEQQMTRKGRNFSKHNLEHLRNLLKKETWNEIDNYEDTRKKFDMFMEIFSHYVNISFPVKNQTLKTKKRNVTWLTKGIKISCAEKRRLYEISKTQNVTEQLLVHFKNSMWKIVREQEGNETSQNVNLQVIQDGKKITNPEEVANAFNTYFANISEKLLSDIKSSNKNPATTPSNQNRNCNSLFLTPTNPKEIILSIRELKTKFSTGVDEIPDYVIKNVGDLIAIPLAHIFNSSLTNGVFPSCLKTVKLKPLFKKDDTSILVSGKTAEILQTRLSEALANVVNWFNQNKLIINKSKTVALNFHNIKRNIEEDIRIQMSDTDIATLKEYLLTHCFYSVEEFLQNPRESK